jgi:hypothetical protein
MPFQLLELCSIILKDDCELKIGREWNKVTLAYFKALFRYYRAETAGNYDRYRSIADLQAWY